MLNVLVQLLFCLYLKTIHKTADKFRKFYSNVTFCFQCTNHSLTATQTNLGSSGRTFTMIIISKIICILLVTSKQIPLLSETCNKSMYSYN